MKMQTWDVIIIGAGMAGLNCARILEKAGLRVSLLEAEDSPGGRVRTDRVEGFRLDRGFQVLLTAYPECRRSLKLSKLGLGRFEPGALVWNGRKLLELADPLRRPGRILETLRSGVGETGDKWRVAGLAARLRFKPPEAACASAEIPTAAYLRQRGFSDAFIREFMRPFFSGIFLEDDLSTSARMFEFVFGMFSRGYAALPAKGMQAIPDQLATCLKPGTLRCKCRVTALESGRVRLADASMFEARHVVLATDMTGAADLTGKISPRPWHGTKCLFFATRENPFPRSRMLVLNGTGKGPISNISIPSDVGAAYAPRGQALVCVSLRPGAPADPENVIGEIRAWSGNPSLPLRFLRGYDIPHALPRQDPGDNPFGKAPVKLQNGIWVCGDYRYSSSLEGAMASGRAVAEAIRSLG